MRERTSWLRIGLALGLLGLGGCDSSPFRRTASQPASRAASQPDSRADADAPPDTLRFVPTDAMLALLSRPLPAGLNPDVGGQFGPRSDNPSFINTMYGFVTQFIAKSRKPGEVLGLRLGEAFLEMINYEYAIVLLDCAAKPVANRPYAYRINELQLAGVVRCGEHSERFLEMISKTVNAVTTEEQAVLETRERHGWRYQVLLDKRLDAEDVFSWGKIGDHFVLAFGEGTFEKIADAAAGESMSAARDEWTQQARRGRANDTYVEFLVNSDQIRNGLDPYVGGAASEFFSAWDADRLSRSHWAFGMIGPGMFCSAHFRIGDSTVERVYAEPLPESSSLLATIPPNVNYAVWDLPLERFLNRFFASLVATRDEETRRRIESEWARIQREFKFDAQADVLANLGDTIIQHKYPMHPLRIPVCVTTLIEIRHNPAQVARAVEIMCNAWQNGINENINKGIVMPAVLTRDADGIWFLNFGLAGPAWIVTDRFIVASWSPMALRDYLNVAGESVGKVIHPE